MTTASFAAGQQHAFLPGPIADQESMPCHPDLLRTRNASWNRLCQSTTLDAAGTRSSSASTESVCTSATRDARANLASDVCLFTDVPAINDGDDPWDFVHYDVPGVHRRRSGGGPQPTAPPTSESFLFLRSPTPLKNRRTVQACDHCRKRKAKCSGEKPSCGRCQTRNLRCVYTDSDPKKPKGPGLIRERRHSCSDSVLPVDFYSTSFDRSDYVGNSSPRSTSSGNSVKSEPCFSALSSPTCSLRQATPAPFSHSRLPHSYPYSAYAEAPDFAGSSMTDPLPIPASTPYDPYLQSISVDAIPPHDAILQTVHAPQPSRHPSSFAAFSEYNSVYSTATELSCEGVAFPCEELYAPAGVICTQYAGYEQLLTSFQHVPNTTGTGYLELDNFGHTYSRYEPSATLCDMPLF